MRHHRLSFTAVAAPRIALACPGLGVPELVHDLRQELAVVRHLLAEVVRSAPPSPSTEQALNDLEAEVAVIDDLVLSAARTTRWEPVDLVGMARAVVTTTGAVHDGPIELRALPVPPIAGPAVLLRRALSNLVVNACEATPGGRVLLRVLPDGAWVLVEVEDEGNGGAPHDDVPGLGQWIVHAVVRDCGGTVARTRLASGGRRVRLHLPAMSRVPPS